VKRVALIQNRLQFGGRFQVALHMIKVLNERGIVPDFLCFASRFTPQQARDKYGLEVDFTIKKVASNYKVSFEWNILLFNKIIGKHVSGYDLVINHNNTSYLYKSASPTISYVHYPRKDRMLRQERSIHFSGKKRSMFDVAHDAFKLAHYAYKRDNNILPNDVQVANSAFTREALLNVYPRLKQQVPVIYPPIDMIESSGVDKDPKLVVSLGRFSPDKRQDEQIEIAAKHPELKFAFMGFINSADFYAKCLEMVAKRQLNNVELLGDAPKEKVEDRLNKASFFIHSLRNEPFGITAVQAIQAGCIPLVHNSGGQKEVVPIEELRYEDAAEASTKLKGLAVLSEEKKKLMLQKLEVNAHKFSAGTFASEFNKLIDPYL
jgi:glycosyltransferase involved in cell wall biosynthesis